MQLVFLHGPPAVGKLTIALELQRLTGYPLFHNHLTVDLITALFPFGSEPFVQLREQIWLDTFAVAAKGETSLIFTFAPERTVAPDFIRKTRNVIESNKGRVIFVQLDCLDEALRSRIADPSRAKFTKLNSVEQYDELKHTGAFAYPEIPSDLVLDTTQLQPAKVAEAIHEFLQKRASPGV